MLNRHVKIFIKRKKEVLAHFLEDSFISETNPKALLIRMILCYIKIVNNLLKLYIIAQESKYKRIVGI